MGFCFQSNVGILALLDEECLRPGNATDLTFLEKLNQACQNHPHYESKALKKCQNDKTLSHGTFRLKHYAGNVIDMSFFCLLTCTFFAASYKFSLSNDEIFLEGFSEEKKIT